MEEGQQHADVDECSRLVPSYQAREDKKTSWMGNRIGPPYQPPQEHLVVFAIIAEEFDFCQSTDLLYYAGMDLGMHDLAALTSNKPHFRAVIVNGRPVKSINQSYNKRRAQLQKKLGKTDTTKRMEHIMNKRNPQNQPFNLYVVHAYLDSGPNTTIYYLPFGSAIPAHGFLVVFPRTVGNFAPEPAPTIRLLIASTTIDEVEVPQLAADQSYARPMDGASKWQVSNTPTIDASNNSSAISSTPTSPSTSAGHKGYTSGNGNNDAPFASGTQPAWSKLRLPTPAPFPTSSISSTPLPSSPPAVISSDLPRRIAMTVLAVMLALALFLCWRLFRTS
jgi:hypothetical protein